MEGEIIENFEPKNTRDTIIDRQKEFVSSVKEESKNLPAIIEHTNDSEAVKVKQLEDGRYLYEVSDKDNDKLKSFFISDDLFNQFPEDSDLDCSSFLRKKLTGPIIEYNAKKDDGTEEILYTIKSRETDKYKVLQEMTGQTYDYLPTVLFSANLTRGIVHVPWLIDLKPEGIIKIGLNQINKDGTLRKAKEEWSYISYTPTEEEFEEMDREREDRFNKAKVYLSNVVPNLPLLENPKNN
ncbi:MAG: hypothetical protein WCG91_00825 [Candidatus Shapirobacteria bacterium]